MECAILPVHNLVSLSLLSPFHLPIFSLIEGIMSSRHFLSQIVLSVSTKNLWFFVILATPCLVFVATEASFWCHKTQVTTQLVSSSRAAEFLTAISLEIHSFNMAFAPSCGKLLGSLIIPNKNRFFVVSLL